MRWILFVFVGFMYSAVKLSKTAVLQQRCIASPLAGGTLKKFNNNKAAFLSIIKYNNEAGILRL